MPIHQEKDNKGSYYQWGNHGKKYYFFTSRGKIIAYGKSVRQAQAAHANGWIER